MQNILNTRLQKHWSDVRTGVYSVCSINPFVLEAAIKQAQSDNSLLLIESTSNQVDQFGGYANMTPDQFYRNVKQMAANLNFPFEQVVLGGDHLGPNVWQGQSADRAMENAADQIRAYVKAGYTKIHLDTSMRCKDDPKDERGGLPAELVAERAADLCEVAEDTYNKNQSGDIKPVYIIGSDVPIPGGAHEELEHIEITPSDQVEQTIILTQEAFLKNGLHSAWDRVIAVVVQPGIEFSDTKVFDYNREGARELSHFIAKEKTLLYEAHSTDYQVPNRLRQLVEDHFAILKVGPWLTFAMREAVFGLAAIEEELLDHKKDVTVSGIRDTIEKIMQSQPDYWQKHYHGSDSEKKLARGYSLSDRVRYYWSDKTIAKALDLLIQNLSQSPIPLGLISQYLPNQYWRVRQQQIENNPVQLIHDKIREVLKYYAQATAMGAA